MYVNKVFLCKLMMLNKSQFKNDFRFDKQISKSIAKQNIGTIEYCICSFQSKLSAQTANALKYYANSKQISFT